MLVETDSFKKLFLFHRDSRFALTWKCGTASNIVEVLTMQFYILFDKREFDKFTVLEITNVMTECGKCWRI